MVPGTIFIIQGFIYVSMMNATGSGYINEDEGVNASEKHVVRSVKPQPVGGITKAEGQELEGNVSCTLPTSVQYMSDIWVNCPFKSFYYCSFPTVKNKERFKYSNYRDVFKGCIDG